MTCVSVVYKLCTHIKKYVYESCVFWKKWAKKDLFIWISRENLSFHTHVGSFFTCLNFWGDFSCEKRYKFVSIELRVLVSPGNVTETRKNVRKTQQKVRKKFIFKKLCTRCVHIKKNMCITCVMYLKMAKNEHVCVMCIICVMFGTRFDSDIEF